MEDLQWVWVWVLVSAGSFPLPNPGPEASAPTLQRRNREIESRYALRSALAHSRSRAPLRGGAGCAVEDVVVVSKPARFM